MSLAFEDDYALERVGAVVHIPLDRLGHGDGVRSGGLDEAHIGVLIETVEQWPPIIVWGEECLVVDGAHRVEAARRLGHSSIAAVPFVGRREEVFVEAVRRNVEHGLPLSVTDRRRAAERILSRHAEWSDRRIASLCGLSGKTVARLRRAELPSSGEGVVVGLERRVGRDGKARPVQSHEIRDRIRTALEENPSGSLRAIAATAGASPETVRSVRARMAEGDAPSTKTVPVRGPGFPPGPARAAFSNVDVRAGGLSGLGMDTGRPAETWTSDRALLASDDGVDFANWFAGNRVGDDWHKFVWSIPLGRVYEVVDEARRRASDWTAFARLLESRTRKGA